MSNQRRQLDTQVSLEQRRQLDTQVSFDPQLNQIDRLHNNQSPDLPLDQRISLNLPLDQPHQLNQPHGQKTSDSDSGQTDSPAEPPKICYTCARSFPATQFRFRNKATGVRMTECRTCYNQRTKNWDQKKRAREKGWDIHKTASQISRSPDIGRTVALLENLVAVMGGPEKLVEAWHNECWRLIKQKRSSTRLARMYEMLIVLMGQTRGA